jgi:hypothetical protein
VSLRRKFCSLQALKLAGGACLSQGLLTASILGIFSSKINSKMALISQQWVGGAIYGRQFYLVVDKMVTIDLWPICRFRATILATADLALPPLSVRRY